MVTVEKVTFKNWSETTTIKFAATTCSKISLWLPLICLNVFTFFPLPFSNNEKKTPLALLFFVFTRDTLQSFDLTMTYQRACIYSVYPPDLIADVTRVPFETP